MSPACDVCGWMAAVGGMLAFGSFGVPIKSKVAQSVDIDPLVMQTYKTSMCFLTSWLVLLYGEELTFTPWGIVSGLFWVPGGIGTIYAIKNAGLAIGIGVGSSFIVLVSFTWGIFVFDEHVHSRESACAAVALMMTGLLGMAYFSSPKAMAGLTSDHSMDDEGEHPRSAMDYQCIQSVPSTGEEEEGEEEGFRDEITDNEETPPATDDEENPRDDSPNNREEEDETAVVVEMLPSDIAQVRSDSSHVVCCGGKWSRRTLGILAAMFTGIYGGSILVPMKWAPDDAKGTEFLISFGIGAATVNLSLWIMRYLYLCQKHQSYTLAYKALPSFHFRKMWKYGGTCGLLWSIGNFFSILSVEFLGEGVGYSVVQSSILVSGLWGIFYFREIQGTTTIAYWLMSACITVAGILLLSYEHHEK